VGRRELLIFLALVVGFGLGYFFSSRPRTYADCLLAHVRQGMNVEATELAAGACKVKYPETADAVPDPDPRLRYYRRR